MLIIMIMLIIPVNCNTVWQAPFEWLDSGIILDTNDDDDDDDDDDSNNNNDDSDTMINNGFDIATTSDLNFP